MLVLDASTLVAAVLAPEAARWDRLLRRDPDLVTPFLGRSEAMAVLHEKARRREIAPDIAREKLAALITAPVALKTLQEPERAWRVADQLGWAKTYDAEYVALAQEVGGGLATLDRSLMRRVGGLVNLVDVSDLV